MKAVRLLIILLYIFLLVGCSDQQEEAGEKAYINDSEFLLDTIVTIKIYGHNDASIIQEAFDRIRRLENILSVHIEGSDLWRLKENAGKRRISVSKDTITLLEHSLKVSEMSGGLFDVTSGPLINLWDIDPPEGHYPTNKEREEAISLINYKDIEIHKDNNRVYLKRLGMEANLGAIAKGYIADKVKEFLIKEGIESAIINLGGNVLLIGGKPDGSDFSIGVQDPDSLRGEYLGLLNVSDKSVVSSGTYERYFIYKEKAYHHILNPFTGFPQENELKGVCVVSDSSTDGDAFSTTMFLMGKDEGMKMIENMEGMEIIFITRDNELYFSSGLKDIFELVPGSGYVIAN